MSGLGGIAFAAVISRASGAELLGTVTFWITAAALAGFLARRGLDTCLTKAVTISISKNQPYPIPALLSRSLGRTAIVGSILTGFLFLIILIWVPAGRVSLAIEQWGGGGPLLLVAAVPLAILTVVAGYARGAHRVALAGVMDLGVISLVAALGLLVFAMLGGEITALSIAAAFVGVAAAMSAAATVWSLRNAARLGRGDSADGPVSIDLREFERGNNVFMLISLAGFVTQAGAFVLVGPFLAETDLGLARAAERLALLVSFPLTAVNAYITPRLVRELTSGTPRSSRTLLKKACLASAGMAVPIAAVLLLFPGSALALFGPEFVAVSGGLVVMTVTQFATAVTGPLAMLLFLSGRERVLAWIMAGALGACIILFPLGSSIAGVTGFVVAYMVVNVGKAVALVLTTRVGLDRPSSAPRPAAERSAL